jgi:hypothetical protein
MPSLPRPLPPCPARSFPFFSVGVLLPCALLAALGVKVLLTASVLAGWEVIDSLNLIWAQASKHGWKLLLPSAVSDLQALCRWLGAAAASCRALCLPCLHCFHLRTTLSLPCPAPLPPACPLQLSLLVLQGMAPNELVVKRLAMMGCTGVHAVLPCRAALPCCPAVLLCLLCSGGPPQQPCPLYLAFAGPCSCCTDLRLVPSPPLLPVQVCSAGAGAQHEGAAGGNQQLRGAAAVRAGGQRRRRAAAAGHAKVAGAAGRAPAHGAALYLCWRHSGKRRGAWAGWLAGQAAGA